MPLVPLGILLKLSDEHFHPNRSPPPSRGKTTQSVNKFLIPVDGLLPGLSESLDLLNTEE